MLHIFFVLIILIKLYGVLAAKSQIALPWWLRIKFYTRILTDVFGIRFLQVIANNGLAYFFFLYSSFIFVKLNLQITLNIWENLFLFTVLVLILETSEYVIKIIIVRNV